MRQSKIVVSPFGFGEMCHRDFEAWGCGAVLLKPRVDHLRTLPAHHISSMAVDVIRGNRIELPWLAAKVVELGRDLGVPTPATTHIYAALKPHILGTPA